MLANVSLETLTGLMEEANRYIGDICRDAVERADIKDTRKVTITLSVKPMVDRINGRAIIQADVDWAVSKSMPGARGMINRAYYDSKSDGLVINLNDPMSEDPEQTNVFDVIERGTLEQKG